MDDSAALTAKNAFEPHILLRLPLSFPQFFVSFVGLISLFGFCAMSFPGAKVIYLWKAFGLYFQILIFESSPPPSLRRPSGFPFQCNNTCLSLSLKLNSWDSLESCLGPLPHHSNNCFLHQRILTLCLGKHEKGVYRKCLEKICWKKRWKHCSIF